MLNKMLICAYCLTCLTDAILCVVEVASCYDPVRQDPGFTRHFHQKPGNVTAVYSEYLWPFAFVFKLF